MIEKRRIIKRGDIVYVHTLNKVAHVCEVLYFSHKNILGPRYQLSVDINNLYSENDICSISVYRENRFKKILDVGE